MKESISDSFQISHRLHILRCGAALAALLILFAGGRDAKAQFQLLYLFGQSGSTAALAHASDGNLYGTTLLDGAHGAGTVFRFSTNGLLATVYSFTGGNDGGSPAAGLVQASDGNLYGTTYTGGASGDGTVFRITTNGVLTTLYSFTGANDGGNPQAALTQASDGELYGTTEYGGSANNGTVFRISTDGALSTIHSFIGSEGGGGYAGLVQASDGNFWGTTTGGGTRGYGTVFRITTNGVLTTVHSFVGLDGHVPVAGLVQASDGNLYGTTEGILHPDNGGGIDPGKIDFGTVFRITTNGVLTTLYSFTSANDGGYPQAPLTQASDGYLYGTTTITGWSVNVSTLFRISTDGALNPLSPFTLGKGGGGHAGLVQANDGNLYGTTEDGGSANNGTVFRITTNGVLTTMGSFTGGLDGRVPQSLMQASDGNLYGTTWGGGVGDAGTVFRITTNGALTRIYSFPGRSGFAGGGPSAALTQASDGSLWGVAGGDINFGTVFQITNGVLTTVHSFTYLDGRSPNSLVRASDGNLYGTTSRGGDSDAGTVFRITTNGALTRIYSFTASKDGANPSSRLVQASDGNLYGTTYRGGVSEAGTVFRITTSGILTTIYSFSGKGDGGGPIAALIQARDGNLYGTTQIGGAGRAGTVFTTTTEGALTTLFSFSPDENPSGGLVQASDGNLYGATESAEIIQITTDGAVNLIPSNFGGHFFLTLASDGNLYGTSYGAFGSVFRFGLQTGSLQANITPVDAVSRGAQWRVDGGPLQNSGATVSGLLVGLIHTVSFTSISGFTKPVDQTVSIGANSTTTAIGTYVRQSGSLKVTIAPPVALTLAAQWRVDGGPLQTSGATVSGLFVGSHVVSFTKINGWSTPVDQTVSVSANSLATATGTYTKATAPTLAISNSGGQVVLSWETSWTGYILESAENLTPGTAWGQVLAPSVVAGNVHVVTNALIIRPALFYRLRRP